MAVRLKTDDGSIPVRDMKDGLIGVITSWCDDKYIGLLVQRFHSNDDALVTIGHSYGYSFSGIGKLPNTYRVRILRNGETLIIEDNE